MKLNLYGLIRIDPKDPGDIDVLANTWHKTLNEAFFHFSHYDALLPEYKIAKVEFNILDLYDTKVKADDIYTLHEYGFGDVIIGKDPKDGIWKLDIFQKFENNNYDKCICQYNTYRYFKKFRPGLVNLLGTTKDMIIEQ